MKFGQDKFGDKDDDDDDDGGSLVAAPSVPLVPLQPVYDGPLPTPPQKAFQPGSTPAHLAHRFLVSSCIFSMKKKNHQCVPFFELIRPFLGNSDCLLTTEAPGARALVLTQTTQQLLRQESNL